MVLLQALSYRAGGMRYQSGKQHRLLLAMVAAIREHDEELLNIAEDAASRSERVCRGLTIELAVRQGTAGGRN
jgi:hypothetical protein